MLWENFLEVDIHCNVDCDTGCKWTGFIELAHRTVTHGPKCLVWEFYAVGGGQLSTCTLVQVGIVLIWEEGGETE